MSHALSNAVMNLIVAALPWARDAITIEAQEDFQFLLISIESNKWPELPEIKRRQLGQEIAQIMPTRLGELTWMLNFTENGKVIDSYFGGDSKSPEIGF